jgi:hypothetical protein
MVPGEIVVKTFFSANITQGCKGWPGTQSNLFGIFFSDEEKKFYYIDSGAQSCKTFTAVIY